MSNVTRRNILIGGVGLACSGLAWAGARKTDIDELPEGALERFVPQTLGPWTAVPTGNVVLPAKGELSDKTYNDVLVRVYRNAAGEGVALLLAYGSLQARDMQLHRPELCYPAAGFVIKSDETVSVRVPNEPPITARLLDTASQTRPEQVLYWTRIGEDFPTTQMAQRWSVVRQNLRGQVPDGILVRTSTVAPDAKTALPLLRGFVADLVDNAPVATRRLLVGQA